MRGFSAIVAQLVERWLPKPKVASSRLVYRSKHGTEHDAATGTYLNRCVPVAACYVLVPSGRLMLGAEQVVDGLDGVEGGQGNFNENGVPVTHGAVPQSWKLKGFQFTSVLGLA